MWDTWLISMSYSLWKVFVSPAFRYQVLLPATCVKFFGYMWVWPSYLILILRETVKSASSLTSLLLAFLPFLKFSSWKFFLWFTLSFGFPLLLFLLSLFFTLPASFPLSTSFPSEHSRWQRKQNERLPLFFPFCSHRKWKWRERKG